MEGKSDASQHSTSITAGHGLTWIISSGRIQSLRKTLGMDYELVKRVFINQTVKVLVDRPTIGVVRGNTAKVEHIMVPDSHTGVFAGHVLVLNFGEKEPGCNNHFFSIEEVEPL